MEEILNEDKMLFVLTLLQIYRYERVARHSSHHKNNKIMNSSGIDLEVGVINDDETYKPTSTTAT